MRESFGTWSVLRMTGAVRGKDAGCFIDGVEHKHFPTQLAA